MKPGSIFTFALPDGRFGLGRVLARHADVVTVALLPTLWDCAPLAEAATWGEPILTDLALRDRALADVIWLEEAPSMPPPEAVSTSPNRAILDAPPGVILAALLG